MAERPALVKVDLEDRVLACLLTPEERERKGIELGQATEDVDRLEQEKKSATDAFKAKITAAEARCAALAKVVVQGKEYREVRCRRVQRYADQRLEVIREDTGEIIEERPLNPKELREFEASQQARLPLSAPEDETTAAVDEATEHPSLTILPADEESPTDTAGEVDDAGDADNEEAADEPTSTGEVASSGSNNPCLRCEHPRSQHTIQPIDDTRPLCSVIGCGCAGYVDSDPLGVAHYDPAAETGGDHATR